MIAFRQKIKLNRRWRSLLLMGMGFLWAIIFPLLNMGLVRGETPIQCESIPVLSSPVTNTGAGSHGEQSSPDDWVFPVISRNSVATRTILSDAVIRITQTGIKDTEGKPVISFGILVDALRDHLMTVGFSQDLARRPSIKGVEEYVITSPTIITSELLANVRARLNQEAPEQQAQLSSLTNNQIILALAGLSRNSLTSIGIARDDREEVMELARSTVISLAKNLPFNQLTNQLYLNIKQTFPQYAEIFHTLEIRLQDEINRLQNFEDTAINTKEVLYFHFLIENLDDQVPAKLVIPNAETIRNSSATTNANIQSVKYRIFAEDTDTPYVRGDSTETSQNIELGPKETLKLVIGVKLNNPENGRVTIGLLIDGCEGNNVRQTFAIFSAFILIDPNGRITGCAGEILDNYEGFNIGVYDAIVDSPTGEFAGLTPLTVTELPDDPNNDIPRGIRPNVQNNNPYFLVNTTDNKDKGKYSFLLDAKKGQLEKGRTFILLINPPSASGYAQRRIKLVLGDRQGAKLEYTAIALDGRPISGDDGRVSVNGTFFIEDAETQGLNLGIVDLQASVCEANEIALTKTADRATAKPGDIVLYRLLVQALAKTPIENIVLTDLLPLGFNFKNNSVRAELMGNVVNVRTVHQGNAVTFYLNQEMTQGQSFNLIYGAEVTPDSLRGNGQNSASVTGNRQDNNYPVRDGPAIHTLVIRPGIITDAGTIIGKVFVDKNFDGQQQNDEPGVPNAVVFLQDGNRVVTDADGMFSVKNVLPGYHTGTLDLEALPGYTLAPNLYFSEGNSQSRLVHLSPGGMVRMNFGVTPTFSEQP